MGSARSARREPKNPKSCHERALGLLAVRPRSRRELERRLFQAGFEPEEVRDTLGRLERVGLIDDAAFARQMADYQFGSRKAGRRAVTGALLEKGIAPDVVAQVLEDPAQDEEARALELASSKALRMGQIEPAKAFNRLTGLLVRRGYGHEVARSAARRALSLHADD
jgi:regulatory protein